MIRPYSINDKVKLQEILRLNIPDYFHPEEEQEFNDFLDHQIQKYYVIEESDILIGSGGINISDDGRNAFISWGMIHPKYQSAGYGKLLTKYRIEKAKSEPGVELITVRTTQLVYGFYQKLGFEVVKTEKDFWAEGFDLYHMEMRV